MKTAILSLQIALGLCAEAYASGKIGTAQYEKESTELKDAMNVIERGDWTGKHECKSDMKAANGGVLDDTSTHYSDAFAYAIQHAIDNGMIAGAFLNRVSNRESKEDLQKRKDALRASNTQANDKAEPEMQITRAEAILGDIMHTRTQDPLHVVRCELHNTLIKAFDRVLSLETEFGVKSEAVGMYIEQMKAGIIQTNAAIIAAYPDIVQIRDMENGE